MPDQPNRFQILLDDTQYTDPDNWLNFTPTTQRHEIYRTLLTTFSEGSVILIKDAKDYIDSVYADYGTANRITVKWLEYDYAAQDYEEVFALGSLELSQKYKRGRDRTEVGFEPTDFVMKVLNRDEIRTDLQDLTDMDDGAITPFTDEYHTIELDAQTITRKFYTEINQVYSDDGSQSLPGAFPSSETNRFDAGEDITEINEIEYVTEFTPRWVDDVASTTRKITAPEGGTEIDITLNYDIDVRYSLGFVFSETGSSLTTSFDLTVQINRFIVDSDGNSVSSLAIDSQGASNGTGDGNSETVNLTGTYTENINLNEGESLKLYVFVSAFNISASESNPDNLIESSFRITPTTWDFDIDEQLNEAATNCNIMLPWEYFLRLIQKITGRNDCLRSPFFGRTDGEVYTYASDGEGAFYAITNIKQVRGFPISDNPINSSLMEGFKGYDACFLLGLGVVYESDVPYIIIDKLTNLMDKSTVVTTFTAELPGIEWESAFKYIWGNVKGGYLNFKNDSNFILGTPHSPRSYSIPYLSEFVNNEYNVESDFVGSGHLIEQMRNDPYKTGTQKDSDFDEKLTLIWVKRDGSGGYERVKDEDFAIVENIDNPTTQYNLNITPARNLLRHAPLIQCGLAKRIKLSGSFTEYLRFQSGEANTEVNTLRDDEINTSFYSIFIFTQAGTNSIGATFFANNGAVGTISEKNGSKWVINVTSGELSTVADGFTTSSGGVGGYQSASPDSDPIPEGGNLSRNMLVLEDQEPLFDASELGVCQVKITKAQRQLIKEGITGRIVVIEGSNSFTGFIESIKEVNLNEGVAELRFLLTTGLSPHRILEETGDYILSEDGKIIMQEQSQV